MTVYFDASGLARLVVAEAESVALREWLRATPDDHVTNSVGVVELRRLAARIGRAAADTAMRLLARVDELSLTATALARAAQLPPAELRTSDALHVASASELADLTALISYDHRMIAAARDYGLRVLSPGAR